MRVECADTFILRVAWKMCILLPNNTIALGRRDKCNGFSTCVRIIFFRPGLSLHVVVQWNFSRDNFDLLLTLLICNHHQYTGMRNDGFSRAVVDSNKKKMKWNKMQIAHFDICQATRVASHRSIRFIIIIYLSPMTIRHSTQTERRNM